VGSIAEPLAAAGRASELPGLLRRGRLLLLQGAASVLLDQLGEALSGQAAAARHGDELRAALDEIRIGAVADAAGTIHRQERHR